MPDEDFSLLSQVYDIAADVDRWSGLLLSTHYAVQRSIDAGDAKALKSNIALLVRRTSILETRLQALRACALLSIFSGLDEVRALAASADSSVKEIYKIVEEAIA